MPPSVNSRPEIHGLDDLLMAPEQQLHNVAMGREGRRFWATQHRPTRAPSLDGAAAAGGVGADAPDTLSPRPISRGREDAETTQDELRKRARKLGTRPGDRRFHARDAQRDRSRRRDIPATIEAVIELLVEAGVMPERPRALLEAADEDPRAAKLPLLRRLMEFRHPPRPNPCPSGVVSSRFLANTLAAGSSSPAVHAPGGVRRGRCPHLQSGPRLLARARPGAASKRASSQRELETGMPPDEFLVNHDLVTACEVGSSVLSQDVSLFVADQLEVDVAPIFDVSTPTLARDSARCARELVEQRAAGTPWLARGAADVLAMLDMTAWIGVVGLLDECPILPAALTAVLERRTTSVSPTAVEFISTTSQLATFACSWGCCPVSCCLAERAFRLHG